MIPKGWKIEPLGKVAEFRNGLNFTRSSAGQKVKIVGIPHFWQRSISDNHADLEFTTIDGSLSQEDLIQSHDLLFVRSNGNKQLIGRCLLFENVSERISFSGFTIRARLDTKVAFPPFIANLCRSHIVKSQFMKMGGGGNISNLSQDILQNTLIPLPPLAEQKRIAEILSTWDRAIETTEKLIANSEAQKRALMQQLLTGKKRLPGFKGQWRKMRLDQAAHIIVSNVDKKTDAAEQPVRLCNYMDVYRADQIENDMQFMRATATPAQINKFGLKVGDVLITKDSETPEDIAIPSYVASTAADLVCGYHLAIIRPKKALDGRFLKFYFDHPHTRYFFSSRANGATRFGLTVDAIESAPILLPSIEEQARISEVIGVAENKIATLRPAVDALRAEKSALMQQLLTGKRRVKINGEAQAA